MLQQAACTRASRLLATFNELKSFSQANSLRAARRLWYARSPSEQELRKKKRKQTHGARLIPDAI